MGVLDTYGGLPVEDPRPRRRGGVLMQWAKEVISGRTLAIAQSILAPGKRAYPSLPAIPGAVFNPVLKDSFLAPPQDSDPDYDQDERYT